MAVPPSGRAIVVGGGLAGLSAANTVLENGGHVLLIDKSAFCGGNSSKAAGGINAAASEAQQREGIEDSVDRFASDTLEGGARRDDLVRVLCGNSGPDVDWLRKTFDIDLSVVSRLGGHTRPRTHRGKGKPPGMTMTFALVSMLERIAEKTGRARIVTKARGVELLTDGCGSCTGVVYVRDGVEFREHGPVILATGGYGSDFAQQSLLAQHRPDLLHLPATGGDHCTGDGVRLGAAVGARTVDLECVQVHPTGFVRPDDPEAKVKFLASEVLRSVGGLLLDGNGDRFVNELGRQDYITGEMWKRKPPFRLVLNKAASDEVKNECEFYVSRGLMKFFENGEQLAEHLGVPLSKLQGVHEAHYLAARKMEEEPDAGPWPAFPSGRSWDEDSGQTGAGKTFFRNAIGGTDVEAQPFYVATVTPVVHYCLGGLDINSDAAVLDTDGKPIPGLYAAGEAAGGVHGTNRLAGSSLLDCLVFGRAAGKSCASYLLGGEAQPVSLRELSEGADAKPKGAPAGTSPTPAPRPAASPAESGAAPAAAPAAGSSASGPAPPGGRWARTFTRSEVAKHRTRGDCWVIVHGRVIDESGFLPHHPGGEQAILTFAGRDATAEFDMIHPPDVISKYAPDAVIGSVIASVGDEADEEKATGSHVPPVPARRSVGGAPSAAGAQAPSRCHDFCWHLRRFDRYTWCLFVIIAVFLFIVFGPPY